MPNKTTLPPPLAASRAETPLGNPTAPDRAELSRRLGAAPVPVRRLVLRFVLAGLPALVAAVVITAVASVRVGTQQGIKEAKRITAFGVLVVEDLGFTDNSILQLDENNKPPQQTVDHLDKVVQRYIKKKQPIRIKIWTKEGVVVYSDQQAYIGQQFDLEEDSLRALEHPEEVKADVTNLNKEENEFENETKLLEVYQAAHTPDGTALLFEAYFSYDSVVESGRGLWSQFAPIAVGTLLLLELVQIPFAWSMARRLRASQEQRERLLQHAIESSDAERRRIASDLHDGVVQDLTGVSMSLTAASLRNGGPPSEGEQVLTEAGHQIRESVKSLRSLLVDIYPPNLHQEGLESAIADLLGALHNRGVLTDLAVNVSDRELSASHVSLLYRSAQEALRNVTNHANAGRVAVRVYKDGHDVVLVVDDDGRGFDEAMLSARSQEGHVGLRSLAGLLADAGGALEIRSAPGTGTRVEVRLPA